MSEQALLTECPNCGEDQSRWNPELMVCAACGYHVALVDAIIKPADDPADDPTNDWAEQYAVKILTGICEAVKGVEASAIPHSQFELLTERLRLVYAQGQLDALRGPTIQHNGNTLP